MIVINFWGGPGCGKSTTAAWLFSELKTKGQVGYSCEYVTEFAKDLTWEKNKRALECQEYVFGNQSWRMERVRNKVDVIITDSPLPLSIMYNKRLNSKWFSNVVMEVFDSYDNINIYLKRPVFYRTEGRNETEKDAEYLDKQILNFLLKHDIQTKSFDVEDENFREKLLEYVLSEIKAR